MYSRVCCKILCNEVNPGKRYLGLPTYEQFRQRCKDKCSSCIWRIILKGECSGIMKSYYRAIQGIQFTSCLSSASSIFQKVSLYYCHFRLISLPFFHPCLNSQLDLPFHPTLPFASIFHFHFPSEFHFIPTSHLPPFRPTSLPRLAGLVTTTTHPPSPPSTSSHLPPPPPPDFPEPHQNKFPPSLR